MIPATAAPCAPPDDDTLFAWVAASAWASHMVEIGKLEAEIPREQRGQIESVSDILPRVLRKIHEVPSNE